MLADRLPKKKKIHQFETSVNNKMKMQHSDHVAQYYSCRKASLHRAQTVSQQDNDCNSAWTASEWLTAKNANIWERPSRSLNLIRAPRKNMLSIPSGAKNGQKVKSLNAQTHFRPRAWTNLKASRKPIVTSWKRKGQRRENHCSPFGHFPKVRTASSNSQSGISGIPLLSNEWNTVETLII